MSMGELVCGELNLNCGGVRRKDSPGTWKAVVPSKRSFSVFLLDNEAVSDESVLLHLELEAERGAARWRRRCSRGPILGSLGFASTAVPVLVGVMSLRLSVTESGHVCSL